MSANKTDYMFDRINDQLRQQTSTLKSIRDQNDLLIDQNDILIKLMKQLIESQVDK